MSEREEPTNNDGTTIERSAEEIRQEISAGREILYDTVDEINERIQEKLEWRRYVNRYPYVALGAAAGLGFLASGLIKRDRPPLERIMGAVTDTIRDSLSGAITRAGGQGLIKMALYGIATKVTVNFIRDTVAAAILSSGAGDNRQVASAYPGNPAQQRTKQKIQQENRPIEPLKGEHNEHERDEDQI